MIKVRCSTRSSGGGGRGEGVVGLVLRLINSHKTRFEDTKGVIKSRKLK